MISKPAQEEENEQHLLSDSAPTLSYQQRKLLHAIQLQLMDLESTLQYIHKKHTLPLLKQALAGIYALFNDMEPLFRQSSVLYLHKALKRLLNCFGLIYLTLTATPHTNSYPLQQQAVAQSLQQVMLQSSPLNTPPTATNIPKMGGIYLYNQNYARHLNGNGQHRPKPDPELSKQQFREEIIAEINQPPSLDSPQQFPDLFTCRFRMGRENSTVSFHEELKEIADFFKEAQDEAFDFLGKTREQSVILTYSDSFGEVAAKLREEKQIQLEQLTKKANLALAHARTAAERRIAQADARVQKALKLQQTLKPKPKKDAETQANYEWQQLLKQSQRKAKKAEQQWLINQQVQRNELQRSINNCMNLEQELVTVNRQAVYLKLKLHEDALVIAALNKKLRVAEARKIPQVPKRQEITSDRNDKIEAEKERQATSEGEALQSVRKQRKVAKRIMLEGRRGTVTEEKTVFLKRFTQVQTRPGGILGNWALAEIAQNRRQQSDHDESTQNRSSSSTRNNLLAKETTRQAKPSQTRHKREISASRTSLHSSSDQPKKVRQSMKEKNSLNHIPNSKSSMLKRQIVDSLYDESDMEERDEDCFEVDPKEMEKIEELFKKQTARTKQHTLQKREREQKPSHFGQNSKQIPQSREKLSVRSIVSQKQQKLQKENKIELQNDNYQDQLSNESQQTQTIDHQPPEIQPLITHKSLVFCTKEYNIAILPTNRLSQSSNSSAIPSETSKPFRQFRSPSPHFATPLPSYAHNFSQNQLNSIRNTSSLHVPRPANPLKTKYLKYSEQTSIEGALPNSLSSTISQPIEEAAQTQPSHTFRKTAEKQSNPKLSSKENINKSELDLQKDKKSTSRKEFEKIQPIAMKEKIMEEREEAEMKKLAAICATAEEFRRRATVIHEAKCGIGCLHLKRFLGNFLKWRQESKNGAKLHIESLHESIPAKLDPMPVLRRRKH